MSLDQWAGMERPQDPRSNSLFSDPVSINWITNPGFWADWQAATAGRGSSPGGGAGAGAGYFPSGVEPAPTAGLPAVGSAGASGAGAAGASALAGWKGKLVDALPLIGGLLFGNRGPFGGDQMSGLAGMEPELQQILNIMRQRMEAQGPLFSAVNQGAYNLLPNSAKQGNMFQLPSSTGGR